MRILPSLVAAIQCGLAFFVAGFLWLPIAVFAQPEMARPNDYFGIKVVDKETGDGVPLVTLTTVNKIQYVTDSNGWVAFHEPGLTGRPVFFSVESHGYAFAKDGFGFPGTKLQVRPGESARIEIERANIAERMYRLTGQGIYRDSVLLGHKTPLKNPLLNGGVLGQDTVQVALYHNRIYWFWGDTNRASYPLGNFRTSGATSRLPSDGGLDPVDGVDLDYFVDDNGFSKKMVPGDEPGMVWIHGLFVVADASDTEQMFAHYSRRKSLAEQLENGLVQFNDTTKSFDRIVTFANDARLYPRGQAFLSTESPMEISGQPYIYFANPYPTVRVLAERDAIVDPTRYESYTCLEPGTDYVGKESLIERNSNGQVVWEWKTDTGAVNSQLQEELLRNGLIDEDECQWRISSSSSGERAKEQPEEVSPVLQSGSVHWNRYRRRWVMTGLQVSGENSFLGDLWYAEASQLEGPWVNARRIVTHNHYSFYNPAHHPFFDQREGRDIYFQGTFTTMFSAARLATPRYDYNQIMYRLSLDSAGLDLPDRD